MRLSRTTRALALAAVLAVLGALCVASFHTHADGSPRGGDDCVVCQIAMGIAAGLSVLATVLCVLQALLTRLSLGVHRPDALGLRLTRRARAPPLPA